MTKDEMLNPWKSKISCKPAQNFVKCSHLNLPPVLSPQNCSLLFVGRATTFIICRPAKLSLHFAYLRAWIGRKIATQVHKRKGGHLKLQLYKAKIVMSSSTLVPVYHCISSINHAHDTLRLISVSTCDVVVVKCT